MNKVLEERLIFANKLRDDGEFGESIKEYFSCLLDIVKDNDNVGLIHALGGISTNFKVLIRSGSSGIYKNLALAYAREVYHIAIENQEKIDRKTLSVAYKVWADALLMTGKLKESLPVFEKSYEVSDEDISKKANVKAHIGGVTYLMGQKEEGIKIIKEALDDIRTGDMSTHASRISETGCLNGLAKIYTIKSDRELALKTVNQSIQIATDYKLQVRLDEAMEILEKIKAGSADFDL